MLRWQKDTCGQFASTCPIEDWKPTFNGKWKIHTVMVQETNSACTFTQRDFALTGECEGDNGKYSVTGKVEGKKVSWSFKTDYNGSPITVSYKGAISADAKIARASRVAEMSLDGDFTAIKNTDASAK